MSAHYMWTHIVFWFVISLWLTILLSYLIEKWWREKRGLKG